MNGAPKPLNGSPRPSTEGVKNIIAFNDNGEIIGAIFSVSTLKSEGEIEAIVGWFLTSPDLWLIKRVRATDALVQRGHYLRAMLLRSRYAIGRLTCAFRS